MISHVIISIHGNAVVHFPSFFGLVMNEMKPPVDPVSPAARQDSCPAVKSQLRTGGMDDLMLSCAVQTMSTQIQTGGVMVIN